MFVVLSLVGLIVIIYDPSPSSRHLIGVALTVPGVDCCAAYSVITRHWIPDAKEASQVILAQQVHALVLALGLAVLVALAGGAFAPASLTPLGLGCALVV